MSKKNKKHSQKSVSSAGNKQNSSNAAMVNQSENSTLNFKSPFTATLILLTDWHIGSGAGRTGDIDSLVKRDRDGFPYVPAKTLTGIWRDACELVALGLDNGSDNTNDRPSWQQWVNYIFGDQPAAQPSEQSPREAALSVRAAHLSKSLREALQGKPELKNALTFVKPGIKIAADNGCAIEDCLRFEEMVRGGTILEAKCELNLENLNAEQKQTAYGLLLAGTKLVERLGGKRRRGSGKCRLVVIEDIKRRVEADIEPWIDWIENHPDPPVLPEPRAKDSTSNGKEVQYSEDKSWLFIPLKITTKSPLVISKRTVGNVVETLGYIPGTHLLTIISKKLGNLGVNLGSAIAAGDIIVTNATIEVAGEKGRPVPFALFGEKLGGGLKEGRKVHNRFLEPEPPDAQLKGERVGYIGSMNNSYLPKYDKVNLSVGTHNTIQDDVQRPTSDVGGIYSYEAIAPGTVLQFELRLRKSIADALSKKNQNWLKSLNLNGDYRLGQSKKDDYGHVSLELFKPLDSSQKTPETKSSKLTVWLLSDVLLRDERLRPTTSINDLAKELGQALEGNLKLKQAKDKNDDKLTLIARQHRVESWQVRWGLPRPSLVGFAAGSCAVFEVEGTLDPLKLAEVGKSGIGERRAEGYGQICFNDPILLLETSKLEAEDNHKKEPQQAPPPLIKSGDRDFFYARIVEEAAWREAIHRASLFLAANQQSRFRVLAIKIIEQEGKKQSKPTMSQLGALRSILTKLEAPAEPNVMTWFNHLKDTKNRLEKWEEGEKSLSTVRELIENPTQVWHHLAQALQELQHPNFSQLTLTQEGEKYFKEQLWVEAVQVLVDACIRAHKRNIEPNSNATQEQGGE